jgi:hypothetical protein
MRSYSRTYLSYVFFPFLMICSFSEIYIAVERLTLWHSYVPDLQELKILGTAQRPLSVTDLSVLKCISCCEIQMLLKTNQFIYSFS